MREEAVVPVSEDIIDDIMSSDNDSDDHLDHDENEQNISDDHQPGQLLAFPLDILDLKSSRKNALLRLRCRVEDAILGGYIYGKNKNKLLSVKSITEDLTGISLWGVPLLPIKGNENTNTDIVLMNFLKAKDYGVYDSFKMLRKTLRWRREFRVNEIVDEKFSPELENLWYTDNGKDKEGRILCYNVFRNIKNKELEEEIWGRHNHHHECLRWRVHIIEKAIQQLEFKQGAVNSVLMITDLGNSPGNSWREVRWINRKMMSLVHDLYPGLIYKNILINVPIWFSTVHALNLRMITQRSKNTFIFVKPSKVTETLLKYISPENLLAEYGGLKKEKDVEFSTDDKVLEISIKPCSVGFIKMPVKEVEVTITWDLIVVGNEVTYKEEFIPDDDCSYRVLLQEDKKMVESVRNSFHIREEGKIVITIDNPTYKKKTAFYRYKTKPSVPMYMYLK
ncbi:patellin-4-like isoform X1 [Lycium ferocissimum]|uniref:patellin-4-like isoform X1 n=1 Tax=Lycium ferocissimum TaxID=112874 RepID=UPI0028154B69|nr:patellin-4-like isoform X1 [Lycium ferocissimum]